VTPVGAATHPIRWVRRRARLADWHTTTASPHPARETVWRAVRWHALAAAAVLSAYWGASDPQAALGAGLLAGFALLIALASLLAWSTLAAANALVDRLRR
jgi:hypothetical protein